MVERARRGDAAAWERLYRAVYPRLRAYATARCGVVVAEDLVNETMARAVASIRRYRWEANGFDPWLFGILRRVCAEHYRREDRQRRKDARITPMANGSDPIENLELADDHAAVRKAFAQLTPDEREVLELRLISQLSAEDTGRVLGKQAGAVRTAQSRALANLRALMEPHR
jgi:RNA polymerase sigma-70 factor (ECF subfamily)